MPSVLAEVVLAEVLADDAPRRDHRALDADARAFHDCRHFRPAAFGDNRLILPDRRSVDGDSVGSVFFGSLALRDALSKPLSRLESWFSWISSSSIGGLTFRRRAMHQAAGDKAGA
jgi:hypothetical protein